MLNYLPLNFHRQDTDYHLKRECEDFFTSNVLVQNKYVYVELILCSIDICVWPWVSGFCRFEIACGVKVGLRQVGGERGCTVRVNGVVGGTAEISGNGNVSTNTTLIGPTTTNATSDQQQYESSKNPFSPL